MLFASISHGRLEYFISKSTLAEKHKKKTIKQQEARENYNIVNLELAKDNLTAETHSKNLTSPLQSISSNPAQKISTHTKKIKVTRAKKTHNIGNVSGKRSQAPGDAWGTPSPTLLYLPTRGKL